MPADTTIRTKPASLRKCPVTIGFNLSGRAKPVYCGQWSCRECAKRLSKKWAKRVRDHINFQSAQHLAATGKVQPDYWFITLTLGSRYKTTVRGFEVLPKLWKRLHQQMKRLNPDWQYVAFVEGQPQRGWMPHFHVISTMPLPVRRNKNGIVTKHATHDYAHNMGWGYQVEQEQVNSARNAMYIAKYASKQSPKTPRGFRRVRPSQNWRKLDKDPTKRLIVIGRGEGLAEFLSRVTEATKLSQSEAYLAFFEQWNEFRDVLGPPPRKW